MKPSQPNQKHFLLKIVILVSMLLGLPLMGALIAGLPLGRYLEFPPQTRYVQHAPFSWPAFWVIVAFILASVIPLIISGIRSYRKSLRPSQRTDTGAFPWWGWIGLITGLTAWILAWTRFSWFSALQPHTFSPLWFSYILVINALCMRRTGHSLLTDRPVFFLLLFPTSAVFWWFFEYLNRFVQNWYYVGAQFNPWAYFWYATLPFSTVLPAVLSTQRLLVNINWIQRGFAQTRPITLSRPIPAVAGLLMLSAVGLAGIGVWPNYLFPFLWVSPLLIIICLQTILNEHHVFSKIADGNWSNLVAYALAAILCGGFWEMWNFFSLAKWEYSIPLVHRFPIFEMPLLGYAGYLPFGIECAVIGDMLGRLFSRDSGQENLMIQKEDDA